MFFQWKRIRKYEEAHQIQKKRTKALALSLRKRLQGEAMKNLSKEDLLERLMSLMDFPLDKNTQEWILGNCKNRKEMIYAFQLFLQRALNAGRNHFLIEDFNLIKENADFSLLSKPKAYPIGTSYTIGKVKGRLEKITIKCCAVPTKEGEGRMIGVKESTIKYLFDKKTVKNYNVYVEISPNKPENDNSWEAALVISVYSAIYNKILPFRSMLLGGTDEKGNILSVEEDRLEKALQEDFSYILIGDWKYKNYNLQRHRSYNMIYVHTLQEIFSKMQKLLKNTKGKEFKDILLS